MRFRAVIATASILAFSVAITDAAFAACTRLSFSVNDYGKEGPSNDAKRLLDTYAAKWTSDRGIKKFSVGAKEVTCEMFLNFIVFDEHTCTATANVCWEGSVPAPVKDAKADGAETPFVNKATATKAKARAATPTTGGSPSATAPVTAAPVAKASSDAAVGATIGAPAVKSAPAAAAAEPTNN